MHSDLIYLTQTDTTVGFLSQDDKKLSDAKQRDSAKKILQVVVNFATLQQFVRVPKKHKKFIRKSKRTTFIYPNKLALRVVDRDSSHYNFIRKFTIMYSTSANKTKHDFEEAYALQKSDVAVFSPYGFSQTQASSIYKLTQHKRKKIR